MSAHRCGNPVITVKGRKARLGMVLGGLCVVIACLAIRYYGGGELAVADSSRRNPAATAATANRPRPPAEADSSRSVPLKVVAKVNGEEITRQTLAQECLRHYGEERLESLTNKLLITQECQRRGISITRDDVDTEIKQMAQRFNLSTDQFLKVLKKERGIDPARYASDIVWKILALERLAGKRLRVTQEELLKAYESKYGPKIDARLIACTQLSKAREAHAKATANPAEFAKVAKAYSEDAPSASLGGRIEPIRKHGTFPEIEQVAFTLRDGEISKIIPAGGQFVILQRKREIPKINQVDFKRVAPQLQEMIRDGKRRSAANDVFRQLQESATVVNVLNDPQQRRAMPGTAAVVNGRQITIGQLAQECIDRNGEQVLEGTINHRLIEQACKKEGVTVGEADLQAEIARAAAAAVDPKADGSPDVQTWIQMVTQEQGISLDVYRHDAVWPSVALKKLVGDTVRVTEDEMRKGFEANYGPKVRCRAIVFHDMRRAQRVWAMARNNLSVEYFGELAEQYSIEPGSSALKGVVPPIRKHGGQPKLEEVAFSLQPGELSGIVQVGQQYMILWCEGYTNPTQVDFASVRKYLGPDIHEKKLRIAMAKYFQRLQDTATIDNYLAGTSRRPKTSAVRKPAGAGPAASAASRAAPRR